jgi:hypothetical protein
VAGPVLAPRLRHDTVVTRTRDIYQQLVLRGERIEAGGHFHPTVRWMPPVARDVLRKSAASSVIGPRPQTADMPRSQSGSWPKPELASPAVDVKQLTDDVIQAIDRRIIAGRERMGRI